MQKIVAPRAAIDLLWLADHSDLSNLGLKNTLYVDDFRHYLVYTHLVYIIKELSTKFGGNPSRIG